MRALSLWQPWATAMRAGVKHVETRSWAPPSTVEVPFLLAIHASKHLEPCFDDNMERDLMTGITIARGAGVVGVDTHGVLGVVRVVLVEPTETAKTRLSERELRWGNYSDGRFAWFTDPVCWLGAPIPCRGFQGLWHLPGNVAAQLPVADFEVRPETCALFEDE